jgi:hypothetical protein
MLSFARSRLFNVAIKNFKQTETLLPTLATPVRKYSSHVESNEEFDARWEAFFKK